MVGEGEEFFYKHLHAFLCRWVKMICLELCSRNDISVSRHDTMLPLTMCHVIQNCCLYLRGKKTRKEKEK